MTAESWEAFLAEGGGELDKIGDKELNALLNGEISPKELFKPLDGDGEEPAAPAEAPKKKRRLQGNALRLEEPKPWPSPVDGAELLREMVDVLRLYVVMSEEQATAEALWVAHTYLLDRAECSPLLVISSPVKRCGKTCNLRLLKAMVNRPLLASNLTPAATFRAVEAACPTLLIDEVDSFLDGQDELRGVINSGHTRDAAFVIRTVGDDHEPRTFSTWCPKALALIGKLPPTLEDRSIEIRLSRKRAGEQVLPLKAKALGHFDVLRRKIARFAVDIAELVGDAEPAIPESLNDRQSDNWEPLFAIADAAGGEWPEKARRAALALSGAEEGDDEVGIMLLADLAVIFEEAGAGRLPTAEILERLHEMEGRPWPEWRRGQPLSPGGLARLLKPFGIEPRKIRVGDETLRGYRLGDCEEAFFRYPPPQGGTGGTSLVDSGFNSGTDPAPVPGSKRPLTCDVPRVPGKKGVKGEKELKNPYRKAHGPAGEAPSLDPQVLLEGKTARYVWRAGCRTLEVAITGNVLLRPYDVAIPDSALAAVPPETAFRIAATVGGEGCWTVGSDTFLAAGEVSTEGVRLRDPKLWQPLGAG